MSYTRLQPGLLNNLVRLDQLTCQIPWTIWVEAAYPAIMKMIFSFVEPDPKEVYHIVRGHSALCDVKKGLKKAGLVDATEDDIATRALFRFGEVGDLSLWWFFIAGVVKSGLAEWTSQIINNAPCKPFFSTCSSNEPFGGIGDATQPNSWNGLNWGGNGGAGCVQAPAAAMVIFPGWTGTINASASFQDLTGKPRGAACHIRIRESGRTLDYYDSFTGSKSTTGPATAWGSHTNNTGENVVLEARFECNQIVPFHDLVPISGHLHTSLRKPG